MLGKIVNKYRQIKYLPEPILDLGSKINDDVSMFIKGKVARIGGRVDELVDYQQCQITDFNIPDGGYGEVFKLPLVKPTELIRASKQIAKQELKYWLLGERVSRDRKSVILDAHEAYLKLEFKRKFDAVISSNVIEHSFNPILLLLNFWFLTQEGGYQFHGIPHYKYTFDMYRCPTKVDHFFDDFEQKTGKLDETHQEDYRVSAVEKHGWQRELHQSYPIAYPYMHFHVFDENNTFELFDAMFENVKVDIINNELFKNNLVIFTNKLRPSFRTKYRVLAREYGFEI